MLDCGLVPTRESTVTICPRSRPGPGISSRPPMRVLAVNAGSSSLKLRLLGTDSSVLFAEDHAHEGRFDPLSVKTAIAGIADQIDAVGHRSYTGAPSTRRR